MIFRSWQLNGKSRFLLSLTNRFGLLSIVSGFSTLLLRGRLVANKSIADSEITNGVQSNQGLKIEPEVYCFFHEVSVCLVWGRSIGCPLCPRPELRITWLRRRIAIRLLGKSTFMSVILDHVGGVL